jgi:ABC-type dipeptide/oligopeptide/nickel transport system permease component
LAEHSGDHAEARRCFQAARALDPDNIVALLWLAWLTPNREESLVLFSRVLELDPKNERARAGLRWARRRPAPAEGPAAPITPGTSPVAPLAAGLPALPSQRWRTLIGVAAFLAQRLLFGALVLVLIVFLSHLGLDMARGQALFEALPHSASKSLAYFGRLAQGDLGLSAAGSITLRPVPVAEVIPATLSKSLGLLSTALAIATAVGLALGVWIAGRRHSSWSLPVLLLSVAGVSVPSFFAALLLQLAMVRWAQMFGAPLVPVGGFGWDSHLILPALVLAARPVAQITRVTFVSVGEVLSQDFVRTAHGKGLAPRRVMSRHVLRNAAIPILTTVGLSLRFSLSSLPVVEFFFGWQGVGFTLLKAISRQDDNLTVALVLCLGVLFILVNLALEAGYRLIDPRLRETPPHVGRGERWALLEGLGSILAELRDFVANNPLREWLRRRRAAPSASPFRNVLANGRNNFEDAATDYGAERRRAWLRGTLGNLPFVLGTVLVVALTVVFIFGPQLAPRSPYTTQGLVIAGGKLSIPPFPPSDLYAWGTDVLGRDIMSLVLAGAQQTLLLAVLVVAARLLVGLVLGALAGWLNGSWIDRLLLRAAEVIAAFPTLLLAMILILALGIRQGLPPFVIALCFVGWGEIMQFVRGEVMAIRAKPFIESAMAVGLRTPRIILGHVLPNLASALISIAALEMGAVLMLLGELGFVGIFIGGGAFAELEMNRPLYHYSDVPEWGALLSSVRLYARSYPWTAIYPTLAFFIAILGFNLFGEGLRRMVETVGLKFTRLINRYTVALALLILVGIGWVRANTGAAAFYYQQASQFDGQRALAHMQALADPTLEGRSLGTPGMAAASDYIAGQFEALGLQAAGEQFTYFQNRKRDYEVLDTVPHMIVEDGGPALTYRRDYVEYAGPYRSLGQTRSRVRFLAMGELTVGAWGDILRLRDLSFPDDILLVLSEREASLLSRVPRRGVLVVADDPLDVERRYTLSGRDPNDIIFGTNREISWDRPALRISEATADRLLATTGHSVADLRSMAEGLNRDEVVTVTADVTVSMEVKGTVHEKTVARHVIGHLPGASGRAAEGEAQLDNHLIVVLAQYDSPPLVPGATPYPAANDNASGVAVMLETIRTMQASGYQPYKTFLFVAYSGEGQEGGEWVSRPEVAKFLQAKLGFDTSFDVEAIVELRGLGAGQGDGLSLSTGDSLRLANLFETSAHRMGIPVSRRKEPVDMSIIFEDKKLQAGGQEAPSIGLGWQGWEATSRLPADTPETVSADKLELAGRALALALMTLGRETQY